MATTTGLTADQLKAKIKELKDQGKTESKSKKLGKYVDALKVLTPDKYGAETVASAKLKLASSTQSPSSSSGSSGLGLSGGGSSAGIDLNKMYEDLMNSPEITDLQKQLDEKRKAKDEANANINDNPFYSEATRVGKISKLDEKADREIGTLEQSLAERKADAQVRLNIATQQYNIESQEYQNNLNKLNMLISSGAILNASANDIAQIATSTGMSTAMVNGIISQTRANQISPQVITSTNDAGVVTVSVVDSKTGKVINQSSLGAVGNKQTGGSGGSLKDSDIQQVIISKLASQTGKATGVNNDDYVSGNTYSAIRNQMVSLGYMTTSQFDDLYALSFVNPNYWDTDTYNIVSPKVKETFESM